MILLMPGVRCISKRTCSVRLRSSFQIRPHESSTLVAGLKVQRSVFDFMHLTGRLVSMAQTIGRRIPENFNSRWVQHSHCNPTIGTLVLKESSLYRVDVGIPPQLLWPTAVFS